MIQAPTLFFSFVQLATISLLYAAHSFPVSDLGYAKCRRIWDPSLSNNGQFLWMRFAAPPTGSLKRQVPQTPNYVKSIQDTIARLPRCLQAGSGQGSTCAFPGSLDSLVESPVVVWIHGGGYDTGGGIGFFGTTALTMGTTCERSKITKSGGHPNEG
ncbi:uncharacterized protein BT62DRAFT_923562 [Guyanagaster necrorhizus]|uniref:Carboxylesterase type B domain-containing protein n=1 Tax=Guyanagaster necrorhizus TaxID=856835 RepID=A0A9P7VIE6_9AGAR|nr:uncharacterized protein BT62DRAFT_923562 [Guyanagaster necrorhizus MCA 3950]KAG7441158.1 hypothetical protein BT62DRAFT_923562 [Guyanagaster necrorhizus MCA 3950]